LQLNKKLLVLLQLAEVRQNNSLLLQHKQAEQLKAKELALQRKLLLRAEEAALVLCQVKLALVLLLLFLLLLLLRQAELEEKREELLVLLLPQRHLLLLLQLDLLKE
jgi:hypothetical protein